LNTRHLPLYGYSVAINSAKTVKNIKLFVELRVDCFTKSITAFDGCWHVLRSRLFEKLRNEPHLEEPLCSFRERVTLVTLETDGVRGHAHAMPEECPEGRAEIDECVAKLKSEIATYRGARKGQRSIERFHRRENDVENLCYAEGSQRALRNFP